MARRPSCPVGELDGLNLEESRGAETGELQGLDVLLPGLDCSFPGLGRPYPNETLFNAIKSGMPETAGRAIRNGADVNFSEFGKAPVVEAALSWWASSVRPRHERTLEALVRGGADTSVKVSGKPVLEFIGGYDRKLAARLASLSGLCRREPVEAPERETPGRSLS